MATPPSERAATIPVGVALPDYLHEVYSWAYLNPRNVGLLDNEFVVSSILWGNYKRLKQVVLNQITPDMNILQVAHVYGSLIPELACSLGEKGRLDVIDVSPLQVSLAQKKLCDKPGTKAWVADAAKLDDDRYDLVNCFFLLHEIPNDYKCTVVDSLLSKLNPGGKVIFVDYHKPHTLHPLKPIMRFIFRFFEPFAKELWKHNIQSYASSADHYTWRKETFFGDLYQKVIVERKLET